MPETSSVLVPPASSRRVGVPLASRLRPFALPRPNPLRRVWEGSLRPSDIMRLQTFVCGRGASAIVHIYPSVLQAPPGRGYAGCLGWVILGVLGRDYAGSWI